MQDQDSLGLRMKTIIKAFAGTKALPKASRQRRRNQAA
jgi:hypothetical protein